MIPRIGISVVAFIVAMQVIYIPSHTSASEVDEIAALREVILQSESQFAKFSAETSTFRWEGDLNGNPISSEMKRVVQWNEYCRETDCINTLLPKAFPSTFRFIWSDAKQSTIYLPPQYVEQYRGTVTTPCRFQPYSILLDSLGFVGTVSDLLTPNRQSVVQHQLTLSGAEEHGGINTVKICRTCCLPGSRFKNLIELRLAIDHGHLPCWGRCVDVEGNVERPIVESHVESFIDFQDGRSLMKELRVTKFSQSTDGISTTIMTLSGHPLATQPTQDFFKPFPFLGDPTVRQFEAGQLRSERPYLPPVVEKSEPLPAYVTWLAINGIAGCCLFVLFRILPYIAKLFPSRQIVRSLP